MIALEEHTVERIESSASVPASSPAQAPSHVVLVGNYLPDQQESMERFAVLLHRELADRGIEVQHWRPVSILGRIAGRTTSGVGKWLGYCDKWLCYPALVYFRSRLNRKAHFHVCDHSNSPYLKVLPSKNTSITCHDVLAVRAAEGYSDTYCHTSRFGRLLQRWIKNNLLRADRLVAVSHQTMSHLYEFNPTVSTDRWQVIHLALNNNFYPAPTSQRRKLLDPYGLRPCEEEADLADPAEHTERQSSRFIMHLGSSLPRKNREMLLNMVGRLGDRWDGKICFAGAPVDDRLWERAKELGLEDRIVEISKPDHQLLLALYSSCEAFIFPSFSEGFGWPVIEAQACGAPVIASNVAPMPEVSGASALHADPNEPGEFADQLMSIQEPKARQKVIDQGYENLKRFTSKAMIDAYVQMMAE
ncbi:glycosyltransferase family 4 protein [Stieleria sp. JC731]|uniref:glycosyltransferase family 4 protein n=1 Tax=Pirellulaceae TaxID=2691357 RepID=UPI001E61CEA2|nr:glycosyltransferase family 1 protein [Stieleria sp. JC731]MCC9599942.1 glycosyltransferase family 4 protein [Stieleria sp. JC731]